MLGEAACPRVMDAHCGGCAQPLDFVAAQDGIEQLSDPFIIEPGDDRAEPSHQFLDVVGGCGNEVADVILFVPAARFLDFQLLVAVVDFDDGLHLDDRAALEDGFVLGGVVPITGLDLAGAVGEGDREIRLAALRFALLAGGNSEEPGDRLFAGGGLRDEEAFFWRSWCVVGGFADIGKHGVKLAIVLLEMGLPLLLETVMKRHGFKGMPTEWWHFDLKGRAGYSVEDPSFGELGCAAARNSH